MPGGSRPGSAPGRNRSRDLLPSSSRPKMICAIFPSGEGSIRSLPGLAVKSLASANCWACAENPSLIPAHVALVAKVIGMAEVAGAVSNGDCMLVSRKKGGSQSRAAEVAGYSRDFNGEGEKLVVKTHPVPPGTTALSG